MICGEECWVWGVQCMECNVWRAMCRGQCGGQCGEQCSPGSPPAPQQQQQTTQKECGTRLGAVWDSILHRGEPVSEASVEAV